MEEYSGFTTDSAQGSVLVVLGGSFGGFLVRTLLNRNISGCLSAESGDKHQKGTYCRLNGVSSQLKKDVCSLESLKLIFSGEMVFLDEIKGRIKK